jgi:DNA-binding transcriptional MerR regulator
VAETFAQIPDRDVFKASEVCDIAEVQPYVLRSWEQEFPSLGVARSAGGVRVYRRADVERVLRIKQLVFGEGLTLAGVRRKLEGDPTPAQVEQSPEIVDEGTRARLAEIRHELRSLLDMLEGRRGAADASTVVAAESEHEQPTLLDVSEGAGPWPPPSGSVVKRKGAARGRQQKAPDAGE